jgi:hypothetical protein
MMMKPETRNSKIETRWSVLLFSIFYFLFSPLSARGQEAPRFSPSDKLFSWTVQPLVPSPQSLAPAPPPASASKEFWLLVAADAGLKVMDIESTQRWMRRDPTFYECNPFLPRRPGRVRMYAQFLGGSVVVDYAAWRLRRAGHRNWARVIQVGGIALSAYCVQHNLRHTPR